MDITAIATSNMQAGGLRSAESLQKLGDLATSQASEAEKTADVARQFEAILMRQILSESMKPLLEGGASGQVYGYLVTDSLADTMSKGGGMGLSHILQAQLTK